MFSVIREITKKKEFKLVLVIFLLTLVLYLTGSEEGAVINGGKILRPAYKEGSKYISVLAKTEDGIEEKIELEVNEKQYTKEELDAFYLAIYRPLYLSIVSTNKSLSEITEKINFAESIEGYPFKLTYYVKNRGIFSEDGEILTRKAAHTTIYVYLKGYNWEGEYSFPVTVLPGETISEKQLGEDIISSVYKAEEEGIYEEVLILPSNVDDKDITYSDEAEGKNPGILILGFASGLSIILASKKDKKKEEEKRKIKIMEEYPFVIQKIVMYLSSGMNLRNVWIKITKDALSLAKDNPIYSEMNITVNEINSGVYEIKAYENFGKRIGIFEITRMTTLISQNLRKGSTNLSELLRNEALLALEERKRRAKVKGEEAGTKLLLPMILLMLVVMLVIMIPAFWSI